MKFDEIIEILGAFGLYQKKLYFLVCLPAIPCALQMLTSVFILAIPDHRCRLPNEFNDTSFHPDSQLYELYINHYIPRDGGKWSECQRYDVNLTEITEDADINTNASKVKCNEWVYDTSVFQNTFITEHNLICEKEVYRSHANVLIMAGMLFGGFVFGIVSDLVGRKVALVASIVIMIIGSVTTTFASNFTVFGIGRFVTGISNAGLFMVAFVLGMELVGPSKRTLACLLIYLVWCSGLFLLNVIAFFIRDWNDLQFAISIPSVFLIVIVWFVKESPRWLVSRGKTDQAETILREAAKVNKVELPVKLFDTDTLDDGPQAKVWEMFTSPVLLWRSLIIYFNWFVISMVYYGLGLNVGNLGGDVYLNFTVSNIVEMVAYVLSIFLVDRLGRKTIQCTSMLLGGIACVFTLFPVIYGDESHAWITITLSMIGKLGASAAFIIIYIYSAELFPTIVRNSAMGVSSVCARIGGMLSPYIADLGTLVDGDLGQALPLLVFGGASVAAGLLSLYLPETLNSSLPETIEEAKRFGRKNSTTKQNMDTVSDD